MREIYEEYERNLYIVAMNEESMRAIYEESMRNL
jgi:hypothetical protein